MEKSKGQPANPSLDGKVAAKVMCGCGVVTTSVRAFVLQEITLVDATSLQTEAHADDASNTRYIPSGMNYRIS